jgi:hypothetical protein
MATRKPKVRISRSREVRTYTELWHASFVLAEMAKAEPKGSKWTSLSSILLAVFTLEAYFNHVGPKLFSSWSDLEPLSPRAKLEVILEKVGMDPPRGKDPIQMVDTLVRFRNSLAHGKTHTLKPKDELHSTSADIDRLFWDRPMTDWEKLCTPQFVARARKQVEVLVRQIHSAANIKDEAPFVHGIGFHSATSADS